MKMKSRMMKLILTTFLLSACIGFASAIRCYDCSSVNNSMCLEPAEFDEESRQKFLRLVECGEGVFSQAPQDFFCRKIIQTILRKGRDSEVRVSRGCGWVRSRRECYKADNEDHLETVCQCFEDGCNGARAPGAGLALLLAAVLLSNWNK